MQDSKHVAFKSRISLRIIIYMVAVSSTITLLLTAFQLYRDYRLDLDLIEFRLRQIEDVHLRRINNALWATDASELQMILFKAGEYSAQELKDYDDVTYFRGEYERAKKHYRSMYPSERMKRLRWYGRARNPNARLRTRSWRS